MVSTRDVAERAQVSTATVSNVLNYPERVSEARRRRVLEAMDELGFVRNESARQLRSGQSNTLGLVLMDAWNPFFGEVMRGIEDSVEDQSMGLMVSNSRLSVERERANIMKFDQWRMRGVLVVPTGSSNFAHLLKMKARGTATMLVDRPSDEPELSSVSVDDVMGGALMGQHLKERGAASIVYVGNPSVHTHAADRMRGLLQSQFERFKLIDVPTVDIPSGRDAGRAISELPPVDFPDAVFCANDLLALGVINALNVAGIRTPHDVAVAGYDDIDFAGQAAVPLTTIRQPAYELGRRAAQILVEEMSSGDAARASQVVYTPELIVRKSTSRRP